MMCRYQGFADIVDAMKKIGLFEREKTVVLEKWNDLAGVALGSTVDRPLRDAKSIRSALSDVVPKAGRAQGLIDALHW